MARRLTYKQFEVWVHEESRLNGWDAYVALSREECNKLLQQEYNERFNNESYMPPIDGTYATGETTWTWLQNFVTSSPQLSFENNPDGNGGNVAEANMQMAIVGGLSIELYANPDGQAELLSMKSFDPLDFPDLVADRVLLKDIAGQVGEGGSVVLDLGDLQTQRNTWQLTGSRISRVRLAGGAFMKRKFREAESARRIFVLGQLAPSQHAYMSPERFKLRTVMDEGANVRTADNFGEGALEIRIAMKGNPQGGFPGEGWPYPFPSDRPTTKASLLLNDKLFMNEIVLRGVANATNNPDLKLQKLEERGKIVQFVSTSSTNANMLFPEVSVGPLTLSPISVPLYVPEGSRLRTGVSGAFNFIWLAYGTGASKNRVPCRFTMNGVSTNFHMNVGLNVILKLRIDQEGRKINIEVDTENTRFDITVLDVESGGAHKLTEIVNNINAHAEELSARYNLVLLDAFSKAFKSIEAFILFSLLSNSDDAVELTELNLWQSDLSCFGKISPRLTTFRIDPQNKILGIDSTHAFTTLPPQAGIQWKAENLDGSSENAGHIDLNSGEYTAPGLDGLKDIYKRVKITATGRSSEGKPLKSTALVTIVARANTLNPLVLTCPTSDANVQTREFSANTMKGNLTWEVIGGGKIPVTADPDRTNVYTAPPKDASLIEQTFTIDEVKITNTVTQETQSSYVVLTHGLQTLSLNIIYEGLSPGQVQFSAKFNGKPAPDVKWSLFPETGAGAIDQDGLYKVDSTSLQQFVIIKAWSKLEEFDLFLGDGFKIIPLPFAPFPPQPNPETSQLGEDGVPEI